MQATRKRRSRVYLVGAPVGDHLEDFSQSALDALREVRHLFVEDTACEHEDQLVPRLKKLGVLTGKHQMHSLGHPDETARHHAGIDRLVNAGDDFCILADRGLPGFMDPGWEIVAYLTDNHAGRFKLVPLGLGTAVDGALVLSGLPCNTYAFLGLYPDIHRLDLDLAELDMPAILYVRVGALLDLIVALQEKLGKRAKKHDILALANIRQFACTLQHWFSLREPLACFRYLTSPFPVKTREIRAMLDGRNWTILIRPGRDNKRHGGEERTGVSRLTGALVEALSGPGSGFSRALLPGGHRHKGWFWLGKARGWGRRIHPEGGTYTGFWRWGRRHGHGVETFPSGCAYAGEYHGDSLHGTGRLTFPDGEIYEGGFRHGTRHGHGVTEHPDGDRFEGEWRDGRAEGYGRLICRDGFEFEGVFENGAPAPPGP